MAVDITLTASAEDSANQSLYTFSAQSLGAADPERIIAVVVATKGGSGTILDSATIAGETASEVATTGGGNRRMWMISAVVPSGTSGEIVLNFDQTIEACGVAVYRVIGSSGDFQSVRSSATPPSGSLDVPQGGGVIGGAQSSDSSTFTWTNLTEDYDAIVESSNLSHSGASDEFLTEQSALTITATPSSNINAVLIAASFAPIGEGDGTAAGAATVLGVGESTAEAVGVAGGAAMVQAVGTAIISGVGVAAGQATASASVTNLQSGVGLAAGTSLVVGDAGPQTHIVHTAMIQKPVNAALAGQQRMTPGNPSNMSKALLRSIFRE